MPISPEAQVFPLSIRIHISPILQISFLGFSSKFGSKMVALSYIREISPKRNISRFRETDSQNAVGTIENDENFRRFVQNHYFHITSYCVF